MVDDMWPKCLPFLENPEIGDTEYDSLNDIKDFCKQEYYQLWILMENDNLSGCFLTNIGEASKNTKVVNIFYLCGEGVKIWISELDKKIVEFAKENGCRFYSCAARRGFSRLVPELKETGTLYVREIK